MSLIQQTYSYFNFINSELARFDLFLLNFLILVLAQLPVFVKKPQPVNQETAKGFPTLLIILQTVLRLIFWYTNN